MVPIYDDETVPLPLRILACVNIEVGFTLWRSPNRCRIPERRSIIRSAEIIGRRDGWSKNRNLVYLSARTARRPFALSLYPPRPARVVSFDATRCARKHRVAQVCGRFGYARIIGRRGETHLYTSVKWRCAKQLPALPSYRRAGGTRLHASRVSLQRPRMRRGTLARSFTLRIYRDL